VPEASDSWASGVAYERFMGRWSRLAGARFASWLPTRRSAHWLDVGCGTGGLSEAICAVAEPATIVACDPSASFIDFARSQRVDSRVSFVVAGVDHLPTRAGGFDRVASAFALNFFPDPKGALAEMRRVTAADGIVAASVWDYSGRMEFLRRFWDAAATIDPDARDLDEGHRFPICSPDALTTLFEDAGLAEVVSHAVEVSTRFSDFADFWEPFEGGTGPAPSYLASLDAEQRSGLAAQLRRSLPRDTNGTISLVARAWVVRGANRPA